MASLSQLVSEFANALGQPNNESVRGQMRLLIIQTRNEVIRRSYENHSYVDKVLTQRFRVSLQDVVDGDIQTLNSEVAEELGLTLDKVSSGMTMIKRTVQPVPKPVRLTNNLPFDRVSTIGFKTNREIPFIKETTARFRTAVPGLCGMPCYDYINGFIYIFPVDKPISFNKIVIESAFEHPTEIDIENGLTDEWTVLNDDNEYVLSEDMLGQIRELIYKRDLLNTIKQNNEIPETIKY